MKRTGPQTAMAPVVNIMKFSPDIFRYFNRRGISQYSDLLFGWDLCRLAGLALDPEETLLGRVILSLGQNAVVADWGCSAAFFGLEAKRMRPDLMIYLNDIHPLEAILSSPQDALHFSEVKKAAEFSIGDASTVSLPKGVQADLIVSVMLTPYLEDPLSFVTHLYNQLKPGGRLYMTLPVDIYLQGDRKKDRTKVQRDFVKGLRRLELNLETVHRHLRTWTLIVQRKDRRQLELSAKWRESGSISGEPFLVESYYLPQNHLGGWVCLK